MHTRPSVLSSSAYPLLDKSTVTYSEVDGFKAKGLISCDIRYEMSEWFLNINFAGSSVNASGIGRSAKYRIKIQSAIATEKRSLLIINRSLTWLNHQ